MQFCLIVSICVASAFSAATSVLVFIASLLFIVLLFSRKASNFVASHYLHDNFIQLNEAEAQLKLVDTQAQALWPIEVTQYWFTSFGCYLAIHTADENAPKNGSRVIFIYKRCTSENAYRRLSRILKWQTAGV